MNWLCSIGWHRYSKKLIWVRTLFDCVEFSQGCERCPHKREVYR